jgi:hypothetical protein
VRDEFLGVRHLTQYVDLFERLIRAREPANGVHAGSAAT